MPTEPKKNCRIGHKKSLLLLFFFALSLRLFYLFGIKHSAAFEILLGDAGGYDLWAREISEGNWLGSGVFYQSPLYPYFLGIIYAVFGRDLFIVRLIQIFLGSLSCLFLAAAGTFFFNKKTGFLSGVLLALYPAAVFFDCSIQKAGVGLFLMALLLLLLGRIVHGSKSVLWFVAGVVLGCLGLIRENSLILFPVILFWLYVHFGKEFREKRLFWSGCFILGLLVILLPVGLRNKIVGHDFVLTTSQFGANFYIGNNKTADGLYRELVWSRGDRHYERADAARLAEKEEGRRLKPSEVSAFWFKKAVSDIRSHPSFWIRLMLKKWTLLWNAVEIGDTESQYAYYDWSLLLNFLGKGFHFGVLCPLAAAGLWLTWERRRQLWILYLVLFGYAAGISLFYIFARYRVPMIPVLALFAAAGLLEIFSLLKERKTKKLLLCGGLILASGIFVNQREIPPEYFAATTYSNIASCLENTRPEKARTYYLKAVRLNPSFVKAYFRLGCFLMQQVEFDSAINSFSRALMVNPENDVIHYHTGLSYLEINKPETALHHFNEAVRINTDFNPVVFYKMAVAQAALNNVEAASALLEKAVQKGFSNVELILGEEVLEPQKKEALLKEFVKIIDGR